MRHLELIIDATASELSTALWYLKQRGLAASDDKSSLQITVDGMDYLENKQPSAEEIMPFIKASDAEPSVASETASPAAAAKPSRKPDTLVEVLNRALARNPS